MKKNIYKYGLLFTAIGALALSCDDKEFDLERTPDASELDYEIIQDYSIDSGGNTVILINNTPEIIPVWNYQTGRSQRVIDTVHYAFSGDYTVQFSALTAGGIVNTDPVTLSVTEDNFNYVQDPLWLTISGGVGESKTWRLDLDENGDSKFFDGPQYFYGTDNSWLDGGEDGCYGDDCWNWSPVWSDNTWLMPAENYGTITFNLINGPNVIVDHLTLPIGEQTGTFYIDPASYSLTLTDAEMLHNEGNDACVNDWGNIRIFSLTEDTMQLGVLRRDDCDGAAMLVYNFITQEYYDNN